MEASNIDDSMPTKPTENFRWGVQIRPPDLEVPSSNVGTWKCLHRRASDECFKMRFLLICKSKMK